MKKLNFLWLLMLAFIVGACQSEIDKDLADKQAQLNSEVGISFLKGSRCPNGIKHLIVSGTKVGLIVSCHG